MRTVCYTVTPDRTSQSGWRVRSFAVILVVDTESGYIESLLFVGSRRQCDRFRKGQV